MQKMLPSQAMKATGTAERTRRTREQEQHASPLRASFSRGQARGNARLARGEESEDPVEDERRGYFSRDFFGPVLFAGAPPNTERTPAPNCRGGYSSPEQHQPRRRGRKATVARPSTNFNEKFPSVAPTTTSTRAADPISKARVHTY
jgi:hypothetical protein